MTVSSCFGNSYQAARELFLQACQRRNIGVQNHRHPDASGPGDEALFIDVARVGPKDTEAVLFISSATHGTEGQTGSGVQVALLNDPLTTDLPDGVAVVFVHAVNPYGFAHLRRTNEDNIDLNRNFVDFSKPLPENDEYDAIHPWIVPTDWDGPERINADQALAEYIERVGEKKLQAVLLNGQYSQPDGLFYGGSRATWSTRQWLDIVATEGQGAKHLSIIDIHTGVGPEGYGEPIYVGPERGFDRACSWYGDDVTNAGKGKSHASEFRGPMVTALWTQFPEVEHTAIVLEFGTRPLTQVLSALRADNWLHLHPKAEEELRQRIKADLRNALYVDEDDWRQAIWARSRELFERGMTGLGKAVNHE